MSLPMPDGRTTLLDAPRVIELGDRVGVGAAGSLLAQLGADVVLVEPATSRTDRKWRNRPVMAAGKRSLVLDRTADGDAALLGRLIKSADIVLLSSDVTAGDGAIWEGPRPRELIVCDVTAFGHDGPMSGEPWSEGLIEALAGTIDTTGQIERPPVPLGTPILELNAAMFAVAGALAALRMRRLHGVGQRIDVAIFDFAVTALVNFLPLHLSGKAATRSGNRHPLYSPWGTYPAKDGWILVCAVTDEQWARVCDATGLTHLVSDPRFATSSVRLDNFRTIDELICTWVRDRTVAECELQLLRFGVACGPVVAVEDLAGQTNLAHRRFVRALHDPVSGRTVDVPASPIRGERIGGVSPASIPALDADRQAVLDETSNIEARQAKRELVAGDERSNLRPFSGVRVVEIGQYTVAPMASRIMGALGADVIKVEPPSGDATRRGAPLREDGLAYIFALSNTDKRGLVLDLRKEEDRDSLHSLLGTADILVENLKPGSLEKLGFGGKDLRRHHPRLIYCSVNGFGTESVYPGRPALDTVIQAMSGLMGLNSVDGVPIKAGMSASDMLGGEFALLAMLAGLEHRDRTGEAVHFDLSMQDASAWATQMEWNGARAGAKLVELICAADGYVAVDAEAPAILARLARSGCGDREAAGRLDRQSILAALGPDLPAAPVLTVAEVFAHPQVAARELLVTRTTVEGDSWPVLVAPLRLLSTPAVIGSVMARLGVTDEAVRAEISRRCGSSAIRSLQTSSPSPGN